MPKRRKKAKLSFLQQVEERKKIQEKQYESKVEFEKARKEDKFSFDLQEICLIFNPNTNKKYFIPSDEDDDDEEYLYLPYETMLEIFQYFSYSELIGLIQRVCKGWQLLSCTNVLWESIYKSTFKTIKKVEKIVTGVDISWKYSFLLMLETRGRWKQNKPNCSYFNLTSEEISDPHKVEARSRMKGFLRKMPYHPSENPDLAKNKPRKQAQIIKIITNENGTLMATIDAMQEITVFNLQALSVSKIRRHRRVQEMIFYESPNGDKESKLIFVDTQKLYVWNFHTDVIEATHPIQLPNQHGMMHKYLLMNKSLLFVNNSDKVNVIDLENKKKSNATKDSSQILSENEKKQKKLKELLKDKKDIKFLYPELKEEEENEDIYQEKMQIKQFFTSNIIDESPIFSFDVSDDFVSLVGTNRVDIFNHKYGIKIQSLTQGDQYNRILTTKIIKNTIIVISTNEIKQYSILTGKVLRKTPVNLNQMPNSNLFKVNEKFIFYCLYGKIFVFDLEKFKFSVKYERKKRIGGSVTAIAFTETTLVLGTQKGGIIKKFFGPSELYWAGMSGGYSLNKPKKTNEN